MIGVLSRGILRIPGLESLLGEAVVHVRPWRARPELSAIAGWGLKTTSDRARDYSK